MKKHWINADKPKVDYKLPAKLEMNELCPAFFDLCYWSFFTNSTRVISLEFPIHFPTSSLNVDGGYHQNSHHGQSEKQLLNMAKIETFLLENLAKFIKKMASTKDPEGNGSMLDNTMVLFGSGMIR